MYPPPPIKPLKKALPCWYNYKLSKYVDHFNSQLISLVCIGEIIKFSKSNICFSRYAGTIFFMYKMLTKINSNILVSGLQEIFFRKVNHMHQWLQCHNLFINEKPWDLYNIGILYSHWSSFLWLDLKPIKFIWRYWRNIMLTFDDWDG